MPLILPNTIENDTAADAAELQQNYSTIQTYVNTSLIARDGSVAMTAPLLLSGDPSLANQAANKGYVDTEISEVTATVTANMGTVTAWTPTVTGLTVGGGTTTAHYLKQGRTCHLTYYFVFGAGSTITAAVQVTLPYTALGWGASGVGYLYEDSPSKAWPIQTVLETKDVANLYVLGYDTTFSEFNNIPTSGWATGDQIAFEMTYLTAS